MILLFLGFYYNAATICSDNMLNCCMNLCCQLPGPVLCMLGRAPVNAGAHPQITNSSACGVSYKYSLQRCFLA